MKLRKGDEVIIVVGKDKGKRGKIEKMFSRKDKVLIGGMNQYKRHRKAQAQGQKSEIITISKPLSVSNIMPICPKCNQPTRIGFIEKQGKSTSARKKRICKKCEQEFRI